MFFSRGGRDNGAERNNGETGEHSTSKVGHNIAGLIIGPQLIYGSQHAQSKIQLLQRHNIAPDNTDNMTKTQYLLFTDNTDNMTKTDNTDNNDDTYNMTKTKY